MDTFKITNIKRNVRISSNTNDCISVPAGRVCSQKRRIRRKQKPQGGARCQRPGTLGKYIGKDLSARKTSGKPESTRHRRVQMRPGDVADRVDHRHHDQPEGQCDPRMRDVAIAGVVDHDGSRPPQTRGQRSRCLPPAVFSYLPKRMQSRGLFVYVDPYMFGHAKFHAAFFAALADDSRLRLLHLLKDGETCVCYLQGGPPNQSAKRFPAIWLI